MQWCGKFKVGAHYDSYIFHGMASCIHGRQNLILMNIILTRIRFLYQRGVDQTANSGISMFTLEGREMLGKLPLKGIGGFSGKEQYGLATSVDGSEYHLYS
jgi:hypothetical protein